MYIYIYDMICNWLSSIYLTFATVCFPETKENNLFKKNYKQLKLKSEL